MTQTGTAARVRGGAETEMWNEHHGFWIGQNISLGAADPVATGALLQGVRSAQRIG
jgi:hypothetical protein